MPASESKINLDAPGVLKLVARRVESDLDAFVIAEDAAEGPRKYLGASAIGDACSRRLWYSFRWVSFEQFDARMLRLFNRGHREEPEQIRRLRGAGFQVWDRDADGKQFRFSAIEGHFGGGNDGIGKFPPNYRIDDPFLLEFKTKGTGSGFEKLKEKGMILEAAQHWAQQCTYGVGFNVKYTMYISTNKNDDERHLELAKLNLQLGQQMLAKAESIIMSRFPMNKLSSDPSHFQCKNCHFQKVCHFDAPYKKNCRSCKHSEPVHKSNWSCDVWQSIIPSTTISVGCDRWEPAK